MRLFRLLFLTCFATGIVSVRGQDVVHLKTGESAACKITALTDNIITFSLLTGGGPVGGSAKRTLPMSQVDYVEFAFAPGERAAFAKRGELDAGTLDTWWDHHFAHLHRPRSRTAAFGIALGHALLRENESSSSKRALSLFDRIFERAWAEEDRAAAKQGRLQALIAVGDLETAIGEAQVLASQTEDPELLIEVKFLLAGADFEKLRTLEFENPRWEEDDEVRPERNRLFHRIVDQYLWPHLFHATRGDAAARGLLATGEVYRFGKDLVRAKASYEDLVTLYPDTAAAAVAKENLEQLSNTQSPIDKENQ